MLISAKPQFASNPGISRRAIPHNAAATGTQSTQPRFGSFFLIGTGIALGGAGIYKLVRYMQENQKPAKQARKLLQSILAKATPANLTVHQPTREETSANRIERQTDLLIDGQLFQLNEIIASSDQATNFYKQNAITMTHYQLIRKITPRAAIEFTEWTLPEGAKASQENTLRIVTNGKVEQLNGNAVPKEAHDLFHALKTALRGTTQSEEKAAPKEALDPQVFSTQFELLDKKTIAPVPGPTLQKAKA